MTGYFCSDLLLLLGVEVDDDEEPEPVFDDSELLEDSDLDSDFEDSVFDSDFEDSDFEDSEFDSALDFSPFLPLPLA